MTEGGSSSGAAVPPAPAAGTGAAYLAAAAALRALFGPAMVEVDEFARRSGAFVDALVALDIPAAHVAPARRLRDDALKAANGAPLFRGIVGHFLQQLRGMGLFPQSHAESPEKTLARLYALADAEPPVMSERPQSRRATHVAEPPMPSRRTATLMQRVERIDRADRADRAEGLERGSQPPARTSSIPPAARPSSAHLRIDEGRAPEPEHRLVVLEEPAESSEPIAIKSNYRVSPRPIGEGGAGKVYAARDVDTGLRVAAKVVTIPDPTRRVLYLGLFQNEREIQGSIDDDAIVRIYKTGLTGRGEPYIVMELLTGGSLADYVDELRHNRRRFHLEEARQIGAMAVSAVAVAHRRGVVHKDVKPDNFLFTEDRRRLKLGDFGIAERKEKLTAGVNGTLGYIPPETYEGKLDTEARDVFALGVTLYELLTGYLPFDDESAAASYYDILGRAPIAPSKRRPDRELGPDLDRIVLRALAAKRDDRYATADDMLFELVSSDVRAMIERARAARDAPADDLDAPDPLARETLWSRTMRDAIRKLEHIAEAFAGDRIRAWRLELLVELHRHADLAGDEPLVRETAEMIAHLAPRHEVVQDAALTVVVDFYFDDPRTLLRRAHAAFTMVELEDRAGVLHTRSTDTSPHFLRTLELPRGRIAALGVRGEGIHPVHVPLPVRPGRHSLRIPLYAADEIPADAVLVPAGRVPARNRHGSLSEASAPEDERRVDHDFAITNLVTQGEWLAFLAWIAETADAGGMEAALARAPSSWRFTRTARERFREADGADLDLAAPVRFVGYDDVRAFLAYLAHAPGRTAAIGARLPTLNEIKRAYRGNDARLFPWGDATARRPSVAAFQYLGFLPAPAPMASVPADPRFADRSPFSSPDGPAVFHLAGNVTELVSIGISAADRALIVGAFPATRGEDPADETLGDRYFVTFGLPYDRPAPTNGDVIGVERWRPGDDPARKPRLAYGFRWVVPLRAVSGV